MAGKVGFIGLGAMGGPMALNLAKAGHKLVVHDIDQSKTAAVRAQGAELAGNAEAVAAAVERTILIVETTDQEIGRASCRERRWGKEEGPAHNEDKRANKSA